MLIFYSLVDEDNFILSARHYRKIYCGDSDYRHDFLCFSIQQWLKWKNRYLRLYVLVRFFFTLGFAKYRWDRIWQETNYFFQIMCMTNWQDSSSSALSVLLTIYRIIVYEIPQNPHITIEPYSVGDYVTTFLGNIKIDMNILYIWD